MELVTSVGMCAPQHPADSSADFASGFSACVTSFHLWGFVLQFAPMLLVLCGSLRVVGVACVPTSACVARVLQSHSVVRLFGASDVVICIVERFGGLV